VSSSISSTEAPSSRHSCSTPCDTRSQHVAQAQAQEQAQAQAQDQDQSFRQGRAGHGRRSKLQCGCMYRCRLVLVGFRCAGRITFQRVTAHMSHLLDNDKGVQAAMPGAVPTHQTRGKAVRVGLVEHWSLASPVCWLPGWCCHLHHHCGRCVWVCPQASC
jgi:hypothetical protein